MDIIHRLMMIIKIHDVSETGILLDLTTSVCPEIETSSFDWARQSRYPSPVT
jgi:hypothetical protein